MATKDDLHAAWSSAVSSITSDVDAYIAMSPAAVTAFKSAAQSGVWAIELGRPDLAERSIAVLRTLASERATTPETVREHRAVAKAVKDLRAAARPPRKPRLR